MSAYICDDTTINRILAYLLRSDTHMAVRVAEAHTPNGTLPELGQALRDLNVRAVSQRYPDCTPDGLPGPCPLLPYAFEEERPPTPVEAYKALSCLLYQCSEGDVPETALYAALEDLRARIASEVISRLPAYDQAPWG